VLDFGHTVLATDPVRAKAYPFSSGSTPTTGETVNLMELEGNDIVYVARFPSLHCGQRRPARRLAPARLLHGRRARDSGATAGSRGIATRLAAAPRKAMTAHTVTDLAGLKRALADARKLATHSTTRKPFLGDVSVAAALNDRSGNVVGAINIAVPSPRWKTDDVRRKLAPQVVATAHEIGLELGVL
jgi:DNA-binding IclR family transcriptional regulator